MKYVILGASAAGINAAKTLREIDGNAEIVIASKDHKVYSRCILHHLISNKRTVEELSFIQDDFFEEYKINWIKGASAESIDIDNKRVILDNGTKESYDKLLIATGAKAFIPPVKNLREAKNIYVLRDIEDAVGICDKIKTELKVVIIGAGLVGMDAAVGLVERGIKPSIIEMADRILPLQLDMKAAEKYENSLKEHGAQIYTSVSVQEVLVDKNMNVSGALLSDGSKLDCNLIICTAGVRPNVEFINDDRVAIDRGIVINERCETTCKDIYGAGDVEGKGQIWPIAVKQAIVAAHNMAGKEKIMNDEFSFKNSMNFFGIQTISIGSVNPTDDTFNVDIIEYKDVYKKIVHKEGKIYGALFQGDTSYCGVYTQIIKNQFDVSHITKSLFDIDFSDFYGIKENGEFIYS